MKYKIYIGGISYWLLNIGLLVFSVKYINKHFMLSEFGISSIIFGGTILLLITHYVCNQLYLVPIIEEKK